MTHVPTGLRDSLPTSLRDTSFGAFIAEWDWPLLAPKISRDRVLGIL